MFNYITTYLKTFIKNEKGQAMAEYGIIIALIAAVSIAVIVTLGEDILGAFETIVDSMP